MKTALKSPLKCILQYIQKPTRLSWQRAGLPVIALVALSGCGSQPDKANVEEADSKWKVFSHAEAAQYQSKCRSILTLSTTLFETIALRQAPYSRDDMLDDFNQLDIMIDGAASKSSLYRNVHPEPEVRDAADECFQNFISLYTDIGLSKPLYQHISSLSTAGLDEIDTRYITDMVKGYERSGVSLSETKRERIKTLNEEISAIGQEFNKNIREDVRTIDIASAEELEGLPQDYIDARVSASKSEEDKTSGPITLTTNYPDYFPVMQYAKDDELRRRYYQVFRQRGYPQNEAVLKKLLTKRHELAQILGYKNYAEYVTEDLMIQSPKKAQHFIDKINTIAKPKADQEYQELLAVLKREQPLATAVGDWQKTYLEEKVKQEKYLIDSQEIRQYFSYDKVKQGVFDLTEALFDVKIKPWDTEVWHPTVKTYAIWEGDSLVGKFYLDMHPREGKYKHAAAFSIQDGIKGQQPPISALVCNFPGGDGSEALMEHGQVETFLHEFGHLLHAMFGGHQKWLAHSGIRTERDFVEAPSQMLEEWVWDLDTLKTFATNSKGETIPTALVKKMNAGRKFGKGLFTRHQMFYAATSLNYYNQDPQTLDLTQEMTKLQQQYSPFAYVDDTYFHASFGHLYGYSAVYYTYMWSLVIASDMFSEFENKGLRNTDIADRYRDAVLAPGGSKDAAVLVEDFLGRPYNFKAFAKDLGRDSNSETTIR